MKFSRYMLWSFVRSWLLVVLGAVVIFVVIDFVGNIRTWLNRGMADTAEYYLNYLPHIVYLIMPIAVLIAVVASVGNMARHLELSAILGSGRSGARMLAPLFFLGGLISLGMFYMGEKVLPDANFRRLELAQPTAGQRAIARVKEKSQFAYVNSDKLSWYFQFYSSKRREARQVILLRFEGGRVVERYDARLMNWTLNQKDSLSGNGHWTMINGWSRKFRDDGSILVEPFEKKSLRGLVPTRPEDLIHSRQTADEMDTKTIRQRIAAQKRSGEDTKVLETQLHFKYSGPFVALITLLIGAALSHRYSRSGGLSTKFGIGLLVSFLYYVSIKVGLQMGEGGILSPWLGAWLGSILFGTIAFILLVRSFRL
jgi:lipopolysaccharide export system permease protein